MAEMYTGMAPIRFHLNYEPSTRPTDGYTPVIRLQSNNFTSTTPNPNEEWGGKRCEADLQLKTSPEIRANRESEQKGKIFNSTRRNTTYRSRGVKSIGEDGTPIR